MTRLAPPRGWTVRPVRSDDAEALGSLQAESQRHAFSSFISAQAIATSVSGEKYACAWRNALPREDRRWVEPVIEHQGALLGMASLGPTGWGIGKTHAERELYALYVRPGFTHRGCGRALLKACANPAAMDGVRSIQLTCMRENPAHTFFEALGGHAVEHGAHEAVDGTVLHHSVYVLEVAKLLEATRDDSRVAPLDEDPSH